MTALRTGLRPQAKRVAVWVFVALLVVAAGFVLYFATPFHGSDASIQAVEADDSIDLTVDGDSYVLQPANTSTGYDGTVGLVFYPGARVHPDAYLSSLAPLVRDAGVTVVVPKLPLNLAVLDSNRADAVRAAYPGVEHWYVGGHSLGGAMACRYARASTDAVEGVVLFAAYCDQSIADTDLRVLSVTGAADTVLDADTYERNRQNLPADATTVELPGVNHTQFGSYTGQSGDDPSGTTYAVAHSRLANATVPWMRNASG